MDFTLDGYRVLSEDMTLLYDMYMLCKNSRHYKSKEGKTQYKDIAKDYFEVVKFVIHEEGLDEAKLQYHIEKHSLIPDNSEHEEDEPLFHLDQKYKQLSL